MSLVTVHYTTAVVRTMHLVSEIQLFISVLLSDHGPDVGSDKVFVCLLLGFKHTSTAWVTLCQDEVFVTQTSEY